MLRQKQICQELRTTNETGLTKLLGLRISDYDFFVLRIYRTRMSIESVLVTVKFWVNEK